MKIFNIFIIYIITILFSFEVLPRNIFNSNFFYIEVKTSNPSETKKESINNVKNISLLQLTNKILDKNSRKKFSKIIGKNTTSDQFIKNIIIENEIITDEKYIAKIKINFDKQKIINFLRNNKINYTDLNSESFLIVSSYNINFINIGLDKKKSFNNYLENNINYSDELIKFFYPNLDHNDRYILPYSKIISEDIKAFDLILNKYNLNQLIYISILESSIKNQINAHIKVYDINGFHYLGTVNINNNDFETLFQMFQHLSDEVLFYTSEWWKNKYQINNSKHNLIECKIATESFEELIKIKSKLDNLTQIKFVNTKNIQLNNNIIELFFYGDLHILLKALTEYQILHNNVNGCILNVK